METPKAGSRSGSEKRQRQRAVRVRLDDEERIELETRAGDRELSLAAYIRLCALGDSGPRVRRRVSLDRQLLARARMDLKRIGNNVNQIARVLNSKESVALHAIEAVSVELSATLADLRRATIYDREG
jgi:hypothetical protein